MWPEKLDHLEDNVFYFLCNIFQRRPPASGDIGCKLAYFARTISKLLFFGHQAYKVVRLMQYQCDPEKLGYFRR